ncbi:hypothetical protein [Cypionkella sp. TWP1-2-1b2]|uniref:hypothetical protein n=1 Tax=Cypionkella sp. TWP1-2-1b2 TaxID=2804675 RepID=UPI003CFB7345
MNSQERLYFDHLSVQSNDLRAEPDGENVSTCDCCGCMSRKVWGYLHLKQAGTLAAYFMHWTPGASLATHPANFDLIVGPWGEDEAAENRCAVALIQFEGENGPGVMVIDSESRPASSGGLAKIMTDRNDVISTPFASSVFAMYDAALLQDHRLIQFLR